MKNNNPFINSNNYKRYYTFDYYLKNTYHTKVAKIGLDAGFTCPNRDGLISKNGCLFCSDGARSNLITSNDIQIQFDTLSLILSNKWPNCKYIAYFQAFSNTYSNLETLKEKFEPFINKLDVVAIYIATRPDCLNKQILEYLADINSRIPLSVELGLQTSNDETAKLINRGYSFKTFVEAVNNLNSLNIKVVVHLINGLPNETKNDNLQTIYDIRNLPIHGVKFHSLFIENNTQLHNYYLNHPFKILELDEYLDILVAQLELLPSNIVIQRISGDPIASKIFKPDWSLKKFNIMNKLDQKMKALDTYQGKKLIY